MFSNLLMFMLIFIQIQKRVDSSTHDKRISGYVSHAVTHYTQT